MESVTTDFNVGDEFTIFLLPPVTRKAGDWISEHIPVDAQYFGSAVVVEHRFIQPILDGITESGLTWAWR